MLMVSCKEATMLSTKKAEGRLGLLDRIKLAFHLMMCKFCKMFDQQTRKALKSVKQMKIQAQFSAEQLEQLRAQIKK